MNDKITLSIGMVAIVVAFAGLGIAGQTMINVNNIEPTQTHTHDSFKNDKALVAWINENFVSEGEWKPHNEALTEIFEQLDKKVDGLQSSVTLLQAKGDVVTLPTTPISPDSVDLSLKVSDNKGNHKSGYPRDVPAILIQGESTFLEKTYLITITDPSGSFVKDKFGQTLSDGDISEAWIPTGVSLAGTYKVRITINALTDTITFILL